MANVIKILSIIITIFNIMKSKSGNKHEKSKKNSKENKGGSYKFKIAAKYKKPKTRGDKTYNKRNKK
jgi:hypothetical protein